MLTFANSLYPDHDRMNICPELDPNRLNQLKVENYLYLKYVAGTGFKRMTTAIKSTLRILTGDRQKKINVRLNNLFLCLS